MTIHWKEQFFDGTIISFIWFFGENAYLAMR
jgi:hypothetical protein